MKLDADKVRAILELLAEGRSTPAEIAVQFGVAERTVLAIARRQTWRHVEGPESNPVRRDPETGFWGVTANQTRTRFNAWVRHEGRTYHLGVFRHAVSAARAYDAKARQLGVPPERLNFPKDNP